MQLDQGEKGFSFSKEGPLDMRMDQNDPLTAKEIVNHWSQEKIGELLRIYGEEKRWREAARAIVQARQKTPFQTTKQLAEVIASALSRGMKMKRHPATLVFQGLRIFINRELESLQEALPKAIGWLKKGGRIGVMSFHSLEDRIVKNIFRQAAPLGKKATGVLKLINKKPLIAGRQELFKNPRARSAKLRLAEKL